MKPMYVILPGRSAALLLRAFISACLAKGAEVRLRVSGGGGRLRLGVRGEAHGRGEGSS